MREVKWENIASGIFINSLWNSTNRKCCHTNVAPYQKELYSVTLICHIFNFKIVGQCSGLQMHVMVLILLNTSNRTLHPTHFKQCRKPGHCSHFYRKKIFNHYDHTMAFLGYASGKCSILINCQISSNLCEYFFSTN